VSTVKTWNLSTYSRAYITRFLNHEELNIILFNYKSRYLRKMQILSQSLAVF